MAVYINDLRVVGSGLIDRSKNRAIFLGEKKWGAKNIPRLMPEMLPANERRRTTLVTKLALECIQDLLRDHDDLKTMATVFASSYGDLDIIDKMCSALALDSKIISPTLFHNSVHNAPAGYWSIAASMKGPSTSLSSGKATFMCGLQEAVTRVEVEGGTVLFVAYDYPVTKLLTRYQNSEQPLSIAFRLSDTSEHKVLGTILLKGSEEKTPVSKCRNMSLELLRKNSSVGSALPLVEALVRRARMDVVLPYFHDESFRISLSH